MSGLALVGVCLLAQIAPALVYDGVALIVATILVQVTSALVYAVVFLKE